MAAARGVESEGDGRPLGDAVPFLPPELLSITVLTVVTPFSRIRLRAFRLPAAFLLAPYSARPVPIARRTCRRPECPVDFDSRAYEFHRFRPGSDGGVRGMGRSLLR